jgi:hypothetical protein
MHWHTQPVIPLPTSDSIDSGLPVITGEVALRAHNRDPF